jgi:hypothetical protein
LLDIREENIMQVIAIILVLMSLGTTIVPVGAAVYICRDDLSTLFVPPEVQQIIEGDISFFFADNSTDMDLSSFIMPTYVSSTVDEQTKTFTVTVNFTNPLNYDLTLNAINADALNQDGDELATIQLSAPVTILAGNAQLVTVSGQWNQTAEDYFNNQTNPDFTNITLSNIVIDVNGIIINNNQNIPLEGELR